MDKWWIIKLKIIEQINEEIEIKIVRLKTGFLYQKNYKSRKKQFNFTPKNHYESSIYIIQWDDCVWKFRVSFWTFGSKQLT